MLKKKNKNNKSSKKMGNIKQKEGKLTSRT